MFHQILGKRLKIRRRQFRVLCRMGFLKKNIFFSRKMSVLETCFSNVTLWIYENKTPPWKFSEKCLDYFRDLYLFSEPDNYCFDRATPGQLSDCNWRNTVTVLKTLVKFHKCLKETELLLKNCSSKKLYWKV